MHRSVSAERGDWRPDQLALARRLTSRAIELGLVEVRWSEVAGIQIGLVMVGEKIDSYFCCRCERSYPWSQYGLAAHRCLPQAAAA